VKSITRSGMVAAIAAALTLGVSANAFAAGADEQTFDLTSAINPNNLSFPAFQGAGLFTQTQWLTDDGDPVVPAEGAEEIRIDFDDDIRLTTKKLPKCQAGAGSLATMTTVQAIAACGNAQVGSGAAKVRFAGFGVPPLSLPNSEANFTVTAFNGPKSTAGPSECDNTNLGGPANCEWVGDNKTLYLHAYNQVTNQISLVQGEIQSAGQTLPGTGTPPITAGYGQRLAVTDGTDAAGDAGAVSLFNALVQKKYNYTKKGKKIKADYVTARCNPNQDVDPFVPGTQPGLQFKAETVYDDDTSHGGPGASVDTDSIFTLCNTK